MELQEAIHNRRSIRAFAPDAVREDLLRNLIDLANWAPSAGNLQARDFVIVRDAATRQALARAALDQAFLADAPAVVVVCTNSRRIARYGRRGRDLYAIQDAAAATQNLLLAAHEAGLGTTWVGAFDEDAVRGLLRFPQDARPVALVPIGKPADRPGAPNRLSLTEILHWDRY